jgi:hypothetical protein
MIKPKSSILFDSRFIEGSYVHLPEDLGVQRRLFITDFSRGDEDWRNGVYCAKAIYFIGDSLSN